MSAHHGWGLFFHKQFLDQIDCVGGIWRSHHDDSKYGFQVSRFHSSKGYDCGCDFHTSSAHHPVYALLQCPSGPWGNTKPCVPSFSFHRVVRYTNDDTRCDLQNPPRNGLGKKWRKPPDRPDNGNGCHNNLCHILSYGLWDCHLHRLSSIQEMLTIFPQPTKLPPVHRRGFAFLVSWRLWIISIFSLL